jgi:hypothetical protein
MSERLEKTYLQTTVIPAAEVRWVDYPNEILINNRLFDVKEFKWKKDNLVLKGLFDDEETYLQKQAQNACRQSTAKNDIALAYFFQLLANVFFNRQQDTESTKRGASQPYYIAGHSFLQQWYSKVPSPPPQMVL